MLPNIDDIKLVIELEYWRSISTSKEAADFRDYLSKYPDGQFASLAKRRLTDLSVQEHSEDPPAQGAGVDQPEAVAIALPKQRTPTLSEASDMPPPESELAEARAEEQTRLAKGVLDTTRHAQSPAGGEAEVPPVQFLEPPLTKSHETKRIKTFELPTRLPEQTLILGATKSDPGRDEPLSQLAERETSEPMESSAADPASAQPPVAKPAPVEGMAFSPKTRAAAPASGLPTDPEEAESVDPKEIQLARAVSDDLAAQLSRKDVRDLQARLNILGHSAGLVDGLVGRRTRLAIAAFARDVGLGPKREFTNGVVCALKMRVSKAELTTYYARLSAKQKARRAKQGAPAPAPSTTDVARTAPAQQMPEAGELRPFVPQEPAAKLATPQPAKEEATPAPKAVPTAKPKTAPQPTTPRRRELFYIEDRGGGGGGA